MGDRCEMCGNVRRDVKFRDEYEVPENAEEGYYCDECLEDMIDGWWAEEQKTYEYDNEGNRADSPDYNEDNSWFEDSD